MPCRFKAKLVTEQGSVTKKDLYRIGLIPLDQMHLDQTRIGALTERVHPDGGTSRECRFGRAPLSQKKPRLGFEGIDSKLVPILRLCRYPAVVPVGEQFLGQSFSGFRTEIRLVDRGFGMDQSSGQGLRFTQVDDHFVGQLNTSRIRRNGLSGRYIESGESRTQAHPGCPVGDCRPKCTCQLHAGNGSILQRQESQDSLRAVGQSVQERLPDSHIEGAQELYLNHRATRPTPCKVTI
jgi:hypothetical protein